MPRVIQILFRQINAFWGQLFLSVWFWIFLASCLILAPRVTPLQSPLAVISYVYPVTLLCLLGFVPVAGQLIYRAVAPSVLAFFTGGDSNPLLTTPWQLPPGLARIVERYFHLSITGGTLQSFIIEAGFWCSILFSLIIVYQSFSTFLFRIWPPALRPASKAPAAEPSATGFFERCQSANLRILFILSAAALLGACAWIPPEEPYWEGAIFCVLIVLAALTANLIFSLIRFPPGSGWVLYALLMPGLLRDMVAGMEGFHPAVQWFDYAMAAGWLWMVFLFLNRMLGLLHAFFPHAVPKPRPVPEPAKSNAADGWRTRLATCGVVVFSIAVVVGIVWWTLFREDLSHPVVLKFESIPGTSVCLEHCVESGGEGTLLPDNPPPGTPRTVKVYLVKTDGPLFLRVEPHRQARLAFIDLSVGVQFLDPEGKLIARIDPQDRFPGSEFTEYWSYKKDVPVPALEAGAYTLVVTPYDYGIAWINVAIRKDSGTRGATATADR
jgi:hypothetical protein